MMRTNEAAPISTPTFPTFEEVSTLRVALEGEVVTPSDATYDELRAVWNADAADRPALIVRPRSAVDVSRAVRFARARGLRLTVRGGGHSPAGFSTLEGGLVIDTRLMKSIVVNPATRRVRLESGLTWGEVARFLQPYDLAITAGDVPSVGVAGLTQGGGVGWFVRKHGLAVDRLRAVELVTATGEILRATDTENRELFWGVRGGGANFGVITALEFEAHPGGLVTGGVIAFDGTNARHLFGEYARLAKTAPDDLSTQGILMAAPPLPFLPAEMIGKPLFIVALCHSGDVAEGERLVQAFRAMGQPLFDMTGVVPYAELVNSPLYVQAGELGMRHFVRSHFVKAVDDAFLDSLVNATTNVFNPGTVVQLRVLGGEIARIPTSSTAFSHREAQGLLMIEHLCPLDVPAAAATEALAATEAVWNALLPFSQGLYANFLGRGEEARAKLAFRAEIYDRLARLKDRLDPDNVFSRNANVKPLSPAWLR
ncbi:FAD-binding oxidoreductase [Deinococcus yavapaiensis]|uniref:FAD/FMN-containing dehydrogenase n=1 Tax=Deinococcus yavapaiensis KR-236 TaxID=694435 RepID=A0A318S8T4_9DEIO|nr:FAD-binding oxidoreductase [Deinococcus yavapaiensis]PYE55446.1 FAD/FMN-containing dehydrogenase [Deinococcus yavapaiensis KR-236]